MAKLTIETRTQIPQDAVNAIIHYFPLGPHGQPVRKDRIGRTWVECGTLTLPQVVEMLGQFGISVECIRRDQGPFADQVIFSRRAREASLPRSVRNESLGADTSMNHTGVLAPNNIQEGDRKGIQGNHTILFDTSRARESFTNRLSSRVGDTRGKALAQAAAFVSDVVNHLGSEEDPRQVHPWHLISIRTEMNGEEKITKVSLAPLDNIAPKIAKAIWDYVHALERGQATVEAAFGEFEEAIWKEIFKIPGVLEMLKDLSDPKQ